eukprot:552194-Pleurochrysis_carterae.AAC.8
MRHIAIERSAVAHRVTHRSLGPPARVRRAPANLWTQNKPAVRSVRLVVASFIQSANRAFARPRAR